MWAGIFLFCSDISKYLEGCLALSQDLNKYLMKEWIPVLTGYTKFMKGDNKILLRYKRIEGVI